MTLHLRPSSYMRKNSPNISISVFLQLQDISPEARGASHAVGGAFSGSGDASPETDGASHAVSGGSSELVRFSRSWCTDRNVRGIFPHI
jgi:hypothetical protein